RHRLHPQLNRSLILHLGIQHLIYKQRDETVPEQAAHQPASSPELLASVAVANLLDSNSKCPTRVPTAIFLADPFLDVGKQPGTEPGRTGRQVNYLQSVSSPMKSSFSNRMQRSGILSPELSGAPSSHLDLSKMKSDSVKPSILFTTLQEEKEARWRSLFLTPPGEAGLYSWRLSARGAAPTLLSLERRGAPGSRGRESGGVWTRAAAPLGGQLQPQPPAPVWVHRPRLPGTQPSQGQGRAGSRGEEAREERTRERERGRGHQPRTEGSPAGARGGSFTPGPEQLWPGRRGRNSAEHTLTHALACCDTQTALPQPPDPFPGRPQLALPQQEAQASGRSQSLQGDRVEKPLRPIPGLELGLPTRRSSGHRLRMCRRARDPLGSARKAGAAMEGEDGRRRGGGEKRCREKGGIWRGEGSSGDGEKNLYLWGHHKGGGSPASVPFSNTSRPAAQVLPPWSSPPAKASAEPLRGSHPLPPRRAGFSVALGTKRPKVLSLRTTLGRVHIQLLHAGKQAGTISALAPLSQLLGWWGAGGRSEPQTEQTA
ncbi:hypothetical protein Cadr_000031385, partial [Camelus dromedarius]